MAKCKYVEWEVGTIVKKKSGKAFPDGSKTATITGQCFNYDSGRVAFTFDEFQAPVDCGIVELA